MKKIKNNGFVLAEAIVVSIFVLGMFTYLAMNVLPLIGKYDRVLNYDNPQEIYLANTLYEELIQNEELIQTHLDFDSAKDLLNEQKSFLNNKDQTCVSSSDASCNYYKTLIGDYLKIEKLCINGNECSEVDDRGMKEYYNYFEKQHSEATNYVLIKFTSGRYANIIWQWGDGTNEEQTN